MGVEIGLQRFLPTCDRDSVAGASYLTSAIVMVAAVLSLAWGFLLAFPAAAAFLLFGSPALAHLGVPLMVLLFGGAAFNLSYSYFRGRSAYRRANALKLVAYAGAPIASAMLFRSSVEEFLIGIGGGWLLASLVFMAFERPRLLPPRRKHLSGPFVRYSAARMPGDVLQIALFSGPTFVVTHAAGLEYGAVAAVGTALVVMIGALFAPIGLVLLPRASRQIADGVTSAVRDHVRYMLRWSVFGASVLFLAAAVATPFLLGSFLNIHLPRAVDDVRLILLGAIPYAAYMTGRRGLDATRAAPINGRNIAIAFAGFVVGSTAILALRLDYSLVLALFVVSLAVLGTLTVVESMRSPQPDERSLN